MRISQKLEYACRAMAQLAKCHDGRTLTRLDELAQREEISGNFLVQILSDLRRAGLVESRRGSAGGYLLSRPPHSLTLRQIVDAVEPMLLHIPAATGGESGATVRLAWENASAHFREALDHITVESLAKTQCAPMFYI